MNRFTASGLIIALGSALHAQPINVRGRVSNGAGQPVANAVVELLLKGIKDTAGSDGAYSILQSGVSLRPDPPALTENMRLDHGRLEFTVGRTSLLKLEVSDAGGNILKKESLSNAQPGVYHMDIADLPHSRRMLIIQASIGPLVRTFRCLPTRKAFAEAAFTIAGRRLDGGALAKSAAAVDTLKVSAAGYAPKRIGLASYDATVSVILETDATTVYNPCPANGSPCKILPFGDSITRGAKSSDEGGYRAPLYKLMLAGKQKATFTGSQSHGPSQVSGQPFPRSHDQLAIVHREVDEILEIRTRDAAVYREAVLLQESSEAAGVDHCISLARVKSTMPSMSIHAPFV